jgi:hypothetical protein
MPDFCENCRHTEKWYITLFPLTTLIKLFCILYLFVMFEFELHRSDGEPASFLFDFGDGKTLEVEGKPNPVNIYQVECSHEYTAGQ